MTTTTRTHDILAAGAALWLVASAAWSQADREDVDPRALTLGEALSQATESGDEASLAARLGALGSTHVPPMFDAIATRSYFDLDEHEHVRTLPLRGRHEALLFRTLAELPPTTVRPHLHRTVTPGATRGERDLALQLLGQVGTEEDVPVLLAAAAPDPGARRVEKPVLELFRIGLQGILRRSPAVPHALEAGFGELHPSLVAPLVRTIAALESRPALESLTNLLGVVEEADGLLLLEIGRLAGRVPAPFHRNVCAAIRGYLLQNDVQNLLRASDVIGNLEDREALPILIGLLDHPAIAVAQEADEALQLMTRQDLGGDRDRWDEWYSKTMRWWNEDAPELLDDLRHGEPGEASRALLELSKQRVFRHDLVEHVTAVLDRPENELVLLACAVLGHLGSWQAIGILVERLDDPDAKVQAEAMRALQRITGYNHRDAAPWRELARSLA